jgi:hypothetical protein
VFPADYGGTPTTYASIDAYANALSGLRGSLDFKVKSTSGTLLTGMTVYGTSSGVNVGIGTASPSYKLDVVGEGKVTGKFRVGGAVMLAEPGTGVLLFGSEGGSQTAIYSASQERIRINGSGNVGIGTTSPSAKLQVLGIAEDNQIVGAGVTSVTEITNSYVAAFGRLSELIFSTSTGGGTSRLSAISSAYTGWNAAGLSGDLRFSTRTVGDSALSEKMRIDSAGAIKFNAYNSTNQTGTPTYLLGTDASGNIVKTNTVPGSAAGPYITGTGSLSAQDLADIGNLSGTNTGDQTNISGNAATVTTNANLTGHVTSVGNAAVLGSFTVAQLSAALSDASISGTNTGDQSLAGYATETYVGQRIADLIDSSPSTLNTLNELAAALGDDPNFAATVTASIGNKLPLAGGLMTGTGNITMPDNFELRAGTDSDLLIYHNGTNNFILNTVGNLNIRNTADDGNITFQSDDGSGGYTSYFIIDGGSAQTQVYKNFRFQDDVKANFGTGSDLQIYHDGSNSFIEDVGTGSLLLKSNGAGIYLKGFTSTDTYAQFLEGGAVNLYYDDVKKFETTSTGVTVTGIVAATGGNSTEWNTAYTHSQAAHAPSNAEQNVQSDWNAASGDAHILNKPTIPSGNAVIDWTQAGAGTIHTDNYIENVVQTTVSGSSGSCTGNAATATYATTAGGAPNGSNVNNNYNVTAGDGYGLRFWNGDDSYKISMGGSSLYTYGPVASYSIKTQMDGGSTDRGFTWGRQGVAPIAAINSTSGNMQIAGDLTVSGGDITLGSTLLSNQENTDVDTGTETVANVAIATYTAAFFDFVIKKTTNVRSGTVYACHDGTNVEFAETSTVDLGDTSDVTLSVDISGGNMRLLATTTSNDWSVKSLIRAI